MKKHTLWLLPLALTAYLPVAPAHCRLQNHCWNRGLTVTAQSAEGDLVFAPFLWACNESRAGWVLRAWMELFQEPGHSQCV